MRASTRCYVTFSERVALAAAARMLRGERSVRIFMNRTVGRTLSLSLSLAALARSPVARMDAARTDGERAWRWRWRARTENAWHACCSAGRNSRDAHRVSFPRRYRE